MYSLSVSFVLSSVLSVFVTYVQSPVSCQSGGDVTSRDLCYNVTPEERAVDHPHRLRIPVKLRFLTEEVQEEESY